MLGMTWAGRAHPLRVPGPRAGPGDSVNDEEGAVSRREIGLKSLSRLSGTWGRCPGGEVSTWSVNGMKEDRNRCWELCQAGLWALVSGEGQGCIGLSGFFFPFYSITVR